MLTQKDAVYSAIASVLSEAKIAFEPGVDNVSSLLNRDLRAKINAIVATGFTSNSIKLETQFDSDADLRAYVSGLVSNWVRKDPRLNGGQQLAVRVTGSKDPQLKALRQLLNNTTDPVKRTEIQGFIDARIAELS